MRRIVGTALFALAECGGTALAASPSPPARPEVCREAVERYTEQFGRGPEGEPTPVVLMYKHTFCPQHLTVQQGTVVRFLNVDRRTSHSFWFRDAGLPESERYFSGEGTTMTMDLAPGEHTYLCGPHWEHEGMVGRVTITPR